MAESAVFTLGTVKFSDGFPLHVRVLFDYHLGDTVSIIYCEIILTKIDENNAHLATVPGVLTIEIPSRKASPDRGRI